MSEVPQPIIDRIMKTYGLMSSAAHPAIENAGERVVAYIDALWQGGEKDAQRLTVCGLTFLRELDGRNDPVKEGYTGL